MPLSVNRSKSKRRYKRTVVTRITIGLGVYLSDILFVRLFVHFFVCSHVGLVALESLFVYSSVCSFNVPIISVKRAKGLKVKGKDGTNDAFVTIGLGKEKFR